MQRYQLSGGSIDRHEHGHWVSFSDAEAYGRAQYDEGVKAGCREYAALHESETREAVKKIEDEIVRLCRIVRTDTAWDRGYLLGCENCLSIIRSSGEGPSPIRAIGPAPKLERLNPTGKEGGVFTAYEVARIFNALVDEVESLRRGRE